MRYIRHSEISYCTVFELETSRKELDVFKKSMQYLKKKCNEEELVELTGWEKHELGYLVENIDDLFKLHVGKELTPGEYKIL